MRRQGWILIVVAALALWAWRQHDASPATADATTTATTPGNGARIERPERAARSDVGDAARGAGADAGRWPAFLPPEARDTLALIETGGPFPYRQDGATFQNREHRLPERKRGYYREYTVETPGSRDRGARRIIAGGDPPSEFFYTSDHYDSFRRFAAAGDRNDGDGGAP